MRVLVLSNQATLPTDDPEAEAERWIVTAVESVASILAAAGCAVQSLAIGPDSVAHLAHQLAAEKPDVVFNLFEGHAHRPTTEAAVARFLERARVPFTGAGSQTLWRCLHKPLAKQQLASAGLPIPWGQSVKSLPIKRRDLPWPLIVKPAARDASEGIEQGSVVTDRAALEQRVAQVQHRYGREVLVEEFLPGREFTASLVETPQLTALPIGEVIFEPRPGVPWPLLTYAAKWLPESADYVATDMLHAAPIEAGLQEKLVALAKRAFVVCNCRDYARIDLRLNAAGEPLILDVNPNSDLSPTACFAYAIQKAGLVRADLIVGWARRAALRAAAPAARAR